VKQKHTSQPGSVDLSQPEPKSIPSISNDLFPLSDPPEVIGVTPSRPKRNQLDRVNLDAIPDLPPSPTTNEATSIRLGSLYTRSPELGTSSGPSRSPRRDLPPRTTGPRRGPPAPRSAAGGSGSRSPRTSPGVRPRSARPPRRDTPREETRVIRRREPRPPPPPAKIDQSWDAVFGRRSVLLPVPRSSRDARMGIWAKGMEPAEGVFRSHQLTTPSISILIPCY